MKKERNYKIDIHKPFKSIRRLELELLREMLGITEISKLLDK